MISYEVLIFTDKHHCQEFSFINFDSFTFSVDSNPPPLHTNQNSLRRQRSMPKEGSISSFDVAYKVLLLGDTTVGKTSLKRFIAARDFRPEIGSTIGMR